MRREPEGSDRQLKKREESNQEPYPAGGPQSLCSNCPSKSGEMRHVRHPAIEDDAKREKDRNILEHRPDDL